MRVHDSQACGKMDVTRKRASRVFELKEVVLSFQTGFSLVNAAVVCAILQSISGLDPSSVITEPRYLKLVTVSSFCPLTSVSLSSMIVLQPPLLCEGWGGHPLCLSGDGSVLMDLHWPCDCTAQSSILSICSVSLTFS